MCQKSLFGNINPNGVKFNNGNLVATEGATTVQNMPLSSFSVPYEQLLRGRVTLKKGQCKFLLNHLGLGDNATFLFINATYDDKSKIEARNFVQYSNYTTPNNLNTFSQGIMLTGNSENRLEQLYLTNPNCDYEVKLDIMVGIIDGDNDFFKDMCGDCDELATSSIVKFTNLKHTDIISWTQDTGILAILNPIGVAQAYIQIDDINSVSRDGKELTINDRSVGTIILEFCDEFNAIQAHSILSWVIEDPTRIITNLNSGPDLEEPCIVFSFNVYPTGSTYNNPATNSYPGAGQTSGLDWNMCPPVLPLVVNPIYTPDITNPLTSKQTQDLTVVDLSIGALGGIITKANLISHIIEFVADDRDGNIVLDDSNIIIKNAIGIELQTINQIGDYVITFVITDNAANQVDANLLVNIEVIV